MNLARFSCWLLGVLLALTACGSLPGSGPKTAADQGIGNIEDPSLRAYLRPLALIGDQDCTLRVRGHHLAMRCRIFRGLDRERVAVVYDLINDRPVVAMLIREDDTQDILWLPAQQVRVREPKVVL